GKEYISTEGSINFTLPALIKNSESFQVETPWNGNVSRERIKEERVNFNRIFNKEHPSYQYISTDQIEVVINAIGKDKDIKDLLDDSLELRDDEGYNQKVIRILERKKRRFEEKLEKIRISPKFPFPQGPREYQKLAYNSWVENNYQGIFAMATGTGKTLTSLY